MTYLLAVAALVGHAALCIALINRLHGTGLSKSVLRVLDLAWYGLTLILPVVIGRWVWHHLFVQQPIAWNQPTNWLAISYLILAVGALLVCVIARIQLVLGWRTPTQLTSNHTTRLSISDQLGYRPIKGLMTECAARLPANEILDLSIHEKTLILPQLATELDGLSITHLSDLHFTGRLTPAFFTEVIQQANALEGDMVAITGDIIDKRKCLDWIPQILGQLRSRLGVFFVLGNHDLRIRDERLVRAKLAEAGAINVGGQWTIVQNSTYPIVVAGNELPWFSPAPDLSDCPDNVQGNRPFRILLAHTPDQLQWCRRHNFDLMLAGHTHGGQVRFPVVGPILSPSRHGVRHASGTFHCRPTLLHVSRGISGTRPLRYRCPPELSKIVLRSANQPRNIEGPTIADA